MISGNDLAPGAASAPPDAAQAALDYAYKPSVIGAPMELRLADDALEWTRGAATARIPYARIRRIRLSFRPMTMQNYRFLAEIWPANGAKVQIASTSWKSMFEHERFDAPYSAFVAELSRRAKAGGGATLFVAGSPAWLFWPGVAVFAAALLAMAALAVRALQVGALGGAAFIAGFMLLFLWQGGGFFLRNKPREFDPNAIPPILLPGGSLLAALK